MTQSLRQMNQLNVYDYSAIFNHRVSALFTTRQGGFSSPPYHSLNFGYQTGDDKATVDKNYQKLRQSLPAAKRYLCAEQVHGSNIFIDDGIANGNIGQYDGMISQFREVVLMTYHADCFPIYAVVEGSNWFGLAHAGWRGVYHEIVRQLIGCLLSYSKADVTKLRLLIGPGIDRAHYRVDSQLYNKFITKFGDAVEQSTSTEARLDLAALIKDSARRSGVKAAYIDDSNQSTFRAGDMFFSHRRDGAATGRMLALMMNGQGNES